MTKIHLPKKEMTKIQILNKIIVKRVFSLENRHKIKLYNLGSNHLKLKICDSRLIQVNQKKKNYHI